MPDRGGGGKKMKYKGDELYWIAICDDEIDYARGLRDMLLEGELEPGEFKISIFTSGEELLKASVERYDLLILDIMFPGKDGREVADEFRNRNKDGLLVFCTGKCQPAPEDFRPLPYRFIRKEQQSTIRDDLLESVEEMYRRRIRNRLRLTHGKKVFLVKIEDILYLEISKTGSAVHYYDNDKNVCVINVKEKLKDIYPHLSFFGFEFSHNSYLVNCHYLRRWDCNELELDDGTRLSISRAREKQFKDMCIRYIM